MKNKADNSPLIDRIHKAFGPLAGAIILDLVDLASFGPLGIGGLFVGGFVCWWILSTYNISKNMRILISILGGVYCMLPLTEIIPLATIISAIARFKEKPKKSSRYDDMKRAEPVD